MKKLIMISLVGMSLNVYGTAEMEISRRPMTPPDSSTRHTSMKEEKKVSPSKDSIASNDSISSNPLSTDSEIGYPLSNSKCDESLQANPDDEEETSIESIIEAHEDILEGKSLLELTNTGDNYIKFLDNLFKLYKMAETKEKDAIIEWIQILSYREPGEVETEGKIDITSAKKIKDSAAIIFEKLCQLEYSEFSS